MAKTGAGTPAASAESWPIASSDALRRLAANRIAIEGVEPEIDGGRFAAKAVAGANLTVQADIFGDGHDVLAAALLARPSGGDRWTETPMLFVENDRWQGVAAITQIGPWEFTIHAWRDLFATWRKEVGKKLAAGQRVTLEIGEGLLLLQDAGRNAVAERIEESGRMRALIERVEASSAETDRLDILLADDTAELMGRFAPRTHLSRYERPVPVFADRPAAAFSAWYELMPRSQSGDPARHGTLGDVIARLPYVRDLGFDVLYLPPIHPIGRTNRKGRNNSLTPGENDPGSPYAIGSAEGGHEAIHPELGSVADFDRLVAAAKDFGLEIALDFAIQCSPDHPWIREHPEWFDWRPDGTIKFAENPPKKYEDIVNVHFYREAIPSLWFALRDVLLLWIGRGVKIFRVDNPHTKPFPFWEWVIGEIRAGHPDVIFLAEAFTRPKVMHRLGKIGFSQSYSYFTWRNTKAEIEDYLTELTQGESRHLMRPNFFANTPDINPFYLQQGGRAGFRTRLILAATLAGNYGIYSGFELCEASAMPGKEEYLDSEKYEIRAWDWDRSGHIKGDIVWVNRLRHAHPVLASQDALKFYRAVNDNVLYYGRSDTASGDHLLFHVNLDPHNAQDFAFEVPLWELGLPDDGAIEVEDLIRGNRFTWHGKWHTLRLDPRECPYAAWRLIPPGVAA